MTKRTTDPKDYDRISEGLRNSRHRIKDRDSFNVAYSKFMNISVLNKKQTNFRDNVFKSYAGKYAVPTAEKEIQKGGRIERVAIQRQIEIPARVKTKSGYRVVFAEKTYVMVKGKEQLRYRDSKGRFVSVKK